MMGPMGPMGLLEHLGFRPLMVRGPTHASRLGFAGPAPARLARALWDEWAEGRGDGRSLGVRLDRSLGATSPRARVAEKARGAITALKAMKAKARRAA